MPINLKEQKNTEEKTEIKLNRKMRTWNKYKNYVIIGGSVLVLIIAMFFILRGCGNDQSKPQEQTTTPQASLDEATNTEPTTAGETTTQEQTTTQAAAQNGGVYQISGTASEQEYVGKDRFAGATFLGDSITSGYAYYGYIDEANVIYDNNMTSDKAADYIDEVVATNPSRVFIMVGLNDLNYGTRGTDAVVDYTMELVTQLKSRLPSAQIYVLSVLPITSSFEAGTNINITQSGIDELNSKLQTRVVENGASYIDAAAAFKDGTGYMGTAYTGNGSNLYNEYYPFLLNGIAGVLQ